MENEQRVAITQKVQKMFPEIQLPQNLQHQQPQKLNEEKVQPEEPGLLPTRLELFVSLVVVALLCAVAYTLLFPLFQPMSAETLRVQAIIDQTVAEAGGPRALKELNLVSNHR